MITVSQFTEMALSFPGVIAAPHFERTAFKIINKKIFATLHEPSRTANLMFSLVDQSVYGLINKEAIYPVKNKWGLQGATTFELDKVDSSIVLDALDAAYHSALKSSNKKRL